MTEVAVWHESVRTKVTVADSHEEFCVVAGPARHCGRRKSGETWGFLPWSILTFRTMKTCHKSCWKVLFSLFPQLPSCQSQRASHRLCTPWSSVFIDMIGCHFSSLLLHWSKNLSHILVIFLREWRNQGWDKGMLLPLGVCLHLKACSLVLTLFLTPFVFT